MPTTDLAGRATAQAGLCPDRDLLLALNRGELDGEILEAVSAHLTRCEICDSKLSTLEDAEDGFIPNLRRYREHEAPIKLEEFEGLEAKIRSLSFESLEVLSRDRQASSSPALKPMVPKTLGKYQLLKELGQGGMGIVYAAVHTALNRKVAVKVMQPEYAEDSRIRLRFQREMAAVGELAHPNIVAATDADEADGCHFLVMELVDGFDVDSLLTLLGPLPVPEACEIIRQAAVGLQYVFEHQRVHRDLKPSNLMLSADGVVKILDLGLARLFSGSNSSEDLTRSNLVMGSVDYMAPEQWEDSRKVDIRADIYSLGCSFYKLLVGKTPFSGPDFKPLPLKKQAHAQLRCASVREQRPEVPAALAKILERTLEKDPDQRFDTPQQLADALAPFVKGCDCQQLIAAARERAQELRQSEHAPATTATGTRGTPRPTPFRLRPESSIWSIHRFQRKPWTWAAAILLLGSAGVAAVVFFGQGGASVSPKNDADPDQAFTPGRHTLLKREPTKLVWRNKKMDHDLNFKPNLEQIFVHSPQMSFLSFGKTDLPNYEISLGIKQIHWTGDIGVFFGYHPHAIPYKDKPTFKCQFIAIEQDIDDDRFMLVRHWAVIGYDADGLKRISEGGAAHEYLPRAPEDNVMSNLVIGVSATGLVNVAWDNFRLNDLVGPEAERAGQTKPADFMGDFGSYNARSSGVFGNGTITVISERQIP